MQGVSSSGQGIGVAKQRGAHPLFQNGMGCAHTPTGSGLHRAAGANQEDV